MKTEKTRKDYLNAIDRNLFEGIKEPKDLDPIAYKSQSLNSAIRNFFNYLEEEHYLTGLNGFDFRLWKKRLPCKPNKGKKSGNKIHI
ncbi:MAG: hypothetical protein NZ879_06385, partial [Archaeoglobaceae archaeon]|nr:hypothetical protein [Archaeoglobaceae archaeon]MDW8118593.1 hypothetical protein [Archaeoglobaceae archaeon]